MSNKKVQSRTLFSLAECDQKILNNLVFVSNIFLSTFQLSSSGNCVEAGMLIIQRMPIYDEEKHTKAKLEITLKYSAKT